MITRLICFVLGALVSNYLSGFYAGINSTHTVEGESSATEEEGDCYGV